MKGWLNLPMTNQQRPEDIVIVGAKRTPFTKLLGGLSSLEATDLGGYAIKAALSDAGISGEQVDAVVFGQVLQAGAGQNPTKQAAIKGGISLTAHTNTVNKVCLSGLTAVIDSARLIRSGEANIVVAGGMESMTNAPHLLPQSRKGTKFGAFSVTDHMEYDGLRAADTGASMGALTEEYADTYPATRQEQDHVAALSHQRANEARESGVFGREIAPIEIEKRTGLVTVEADEGIREGVTVQSLSKLRPAFSQDGSITAGNSSPITDGAAAVVLTTRAHAKEKGLTILATLRSPGQIAGPDMSLQTKPAQAIEAALAREGWTANELDLIEINEAFASVVIGSVRQLGRDIEDVNTCGGAIALGHPIGASGARLVVHAAHQIANGNARKAALGLCGGGGQGEALLLSN